MGLFKKTKVSDRTGAIASFVLAIACLAAVSFHIKILLPLLKQGVQTEAIVVGIEAGARGSKRAVYRFHIQSGEEITARDTFQMFIIRFDRGESVRVIYDPSDPKKVTADIGVWVWQGTAIFFFGMVFFFILGILILKFRHKNKGITDQ